MVTMQSLPARCAILLASMLVASEASHAAARGPSARESSAQRATRPATNADAGQQDMEAWLARLKGHFAVRHNVEEKTTCRTMGAYSTNAPQMCTTQKAVAYVSAASCLSVGEGPGVACTIDEFSQIPGDGAGGTGSRPAPMLMLGLFPRRIVLDIEPDAGKLSLTATSFNGGTQSATGSLDGDAVSFRGRCDIPQSTNNSACIWSLRLQSRPDGSRILMTYTRRDQAQLLELSRVEQPAPP